MTHSYDKLIAKCNAYREAAKESKSEAVVDAYKLDYLDCKSGVAPCHSIKDEDVELFCPKMPFAQDELINTMDMEAVKEQAAEENEAKEGAIDEVEANAMEQVATADEQVATIGEQKTVTNEQ